MYPLFCIFISAELNPTNSESGLVTVHWESSTLTRRKLKASPKSSRFMVHATPGFFRTTMASLPGTKIYQYRFNIFEITISAALPMGASFTSTLPPRKLPPMVNSMGPFDLSCLSLAASSWLLDMGQVGPSRHFFPQLIPFRTNCHLGLAPTALQLCKFRGAIEKAFGRDYCTLNSSRYGEFGRLIQNVDLELPS